MTPTSSEPGSTARVRVRPTGPTTTTVGIPGAGVAGVAGALLLAVTNALVGLAGVEDTAGLVRQSTDRPAYVQTVIVVGLLAAVLLVPGIWAVTVRLSEQTPRWAAVGGWLMASGYVLSVALSADTATTLSVAMTGADPAVYIDAVDHHTSGAAIAMYAGFGVGALAGGLILGIAMLRQRGGVPAWAGWALVASEPVRVAGLLLGVPLLPALASVLIGVAFAGTVFAPGRARRSAVA